MRKENPDLLAYFRLQPCELCARWPVEPHHIKPKGMGGGSQLDVALNLVAVCRDCHNRIHAGKIKKPLLLEIIAKREGLLPEEVEGAVWRLLRT